MDNKIFLRQLKKLKQEDLKSVKYQPDQKYYLATFYNKLKYRLFITIKWFVNLIKSIKELFKINK